MDFITLKSQRLLLRPWKEEDRAPFAQMNRDPKVMRYFPSLLSRQESDEIIDRLLRHFDTYGYGLWAVQLLETGEFIGFIGLDHVRHNFPFTPAIEVGWRLASQYWGKGYATEGAKLAIEFAFNQLKVRSLVSFCSRENTKSIAVMQRLGMRSNCNEDFEVEFIPKTNKLRYHVLYRLSIDDDIEL